MYRPAPSGQAASGDGSGLTWRTRGKQSTTILAEWEKLVEKPDARSRKLFAEMVRTSGDLLDAVATTRSGLGGRGRQPGPSSTGCGRRERLKAEPGELAALFFVSGGDRPAPAAGPRRPGRELHRRPMLPNRPGRKLGGGRGPVLASSWYGGRAAARPRLRRPPTVAMLVQAVRKPPQSWLRPSGTRRPACSVFGWQPSALGKLGGKEASAALTDVLADTTVLFSPGRHRLRVRRPPWSRCAGKLADYGLTNSVGIGFATGPARTRSSSALRIPRPRRPYQGTSEWRTKPGKKDAPGKRRRC